MLPIKILKLKCHFAVKDMILTAIEDTDSFIITEHGDDVCPLTDWEKYEDGEEMPEYYEIFSKVAAEEILDVVKYEFGFDIADINKYWFQQYGAKGEHGWHFHPGCLYHAIYYLELPKGCPPTLVRAPNGFEFTPNVEEGDILIMPSILEHTSPPNNSRERKTIIAMNIDMESDEDDENDDD